MSIPGSAPTSWLQAMPKAELHLHLDGSLRPATALELARTRRGAVADVPPDVASMRDRLVASERCIDQADLLRAFDLPIALLQDAEALERVAAELAEDVAGDGTAYAEIRWAPSLHTERGLSLHDGIAAVVRGTRGAAERNGLDVRLIAVALRTHDRETATRVVQASLGFLADGLTGFDIAGIEREAPDPRRFSRAIGVARDGGLGITCHAGEWGGAAQVWQALEIDPWRIAHGTVAVDDPSLMTELTERGVTLDVCPTSNLQAGIGTADHDAPLPRLIRAGVPVTISTDDRTVSDLTLVRELAGAVEHLGVTPSEVALTQRQAYAAAFLHHDEELRAELQQGFEAWLAEHPAPR
ncbi:MAG: adenosine deaminase [Chloroflexota bacterium]|nr:adenosine deaminase [Chloroflexota bacterium]